jgi:hypothetical protein
MNNVAGVAARELNRDSAGLSKRGLVIPKLNASEDPRNCDVVGAKRLQSQFYSVPIFAVDISNYGDPSQIKAGRAGSNSDPPNPLNATSYSRVARVCLLRSRSCGRTLVERRRAFGTSI